MSQLSEAEIDAEVFRVVRCYQEKSKGFILWQIKEHLPFLKSEDIASALLRLSGKG
jgi:hypothetical protein